MSEVKHYVFQHVVRDGTSRSFTKKVQQFTLAADFDRVTAEHDAALGREAALREDLQTRTADLLECGTRRKELQQRLTAAEESAKLWEQRACLEATKLHAADERANVLERLLRKSKVAVDDMAENCEDRTDWGLAGSMRGLSQHIEAELAPAKANPDFRMIGTEKMQPMEYDEP